MSDSPSRRKVLTCTPRLRASGASARQADDEEAACAKTIISTLTRRAYRRPLTDEDLQVPLASYRDGAKRGGFESGIEMAIRSILVSPDFLFRLESQPAGAAPNTPYRLTDLDLASRLSFFLWSSIPDDELVKVAEKNNLHKPEVLQQQVRRMLADPRSSALVDNFAGQWLHIRNVAGHQPSPEVLFHYDDNLRKALEQETKLLFESIIRENRSVIDLLDADYTFLNERLAKHYGIEGIAGERFRRVPLPPDSPRRGLLGQGSILMATSYPNRTSPVIRGKWILENIFGAPPPPPPPNVPELKDERDPRKVLPMREQMAPIARTRSVRMPRADGPAGVRARELRRDRRMARHLRVRRAGRCIRGAAGRNEVQWPRRAAEVLLTHSDEFLTTMTEKLLTYALGRGLEASDAPAVRKIKRDAAGEKVRFESLVRGVVTSIPFQMKMAHTETN